jgi:hypothetical protein
MRAEVAILENSFNTQELLFRYVAYSNYDVTSKMFQTRSSAGTTRAIAAATKSSGLLVRYILTFDDGHIGHVVSSTFQKLLLKLTRVCA